MPEAHGGGWCNDVRNACWELSRSGEMGEASEMQRGWWKSWKSREKLMLFLHGPESRHREQHEPRGRSRVEAAIDSRVAVDCGNQTPRAGGIHSHPRHAQVAGRGSFRSTSSSSRHCTTHPNSFLVPPYRPFFHLHHHPHPQLISARPPEHHRAARTPVRIRASQAFPSQDLVSTSTMAAPQKVHCGLLR